MKSSNNFNQTSQENEQYILHHNKKAQDEKYV